MLNLKNTLIRLMSNSLPIIIFAIISSNVYANIENPTPLIMLHGDPELNATHLQPELQPFEDYKYQEPMLSQAPTQQEDNLVKLNALITNLEELGKNYTSSYAIFAHSIGGKILFEYIKSITTEQADHQLAANPTAPAAQAKSLPTTK